MSNQHKKPILAFVMLAVIAAAVIGNQMRAGAERSTFITAGRVSAHTSVTDRAIFDLPGMPTVLVGGEASELNTDRSARPRPSDARPTRSSDRNSDAALRTRSVSRPVQGVAETAAKSLSEPAHGVRDLERGHACPDRSPGPPRSERLGSNDSMDNAGRAALAHAHMRGSADNGRR